MREVRGGPDRPLLQALREELGLTAAKYSCAEGECGACTVWIDGQPARACVTRLGDVEGKAIVTLEGLAPRALQRAFAEEGAMQCGFCTPGMIMSSAALLRDVPSPSVEQIKQALEGHVCRCGTYGRILRAVQRAAALRDDPATVPPVPQALDTPAPLEPGWTFVVPPSFPEGGLPAGGAAVHLSSRGRLTALAGKVELGQGIRTGLGLTVAQELRIPAGEVQLVLADTALTPWDIGTFGSRTTATIGAELIRACAALRDALREAAASKWSVPISQVEVFGGAVQSTDGLRRVDWGELVTGSRNERVSGGRSTASPSPPRAVDTRDVPNVRGWEIVTGAKRFPSDVSRPGMLYGCVLRPPAFGATLRSADTHAAQAMPGVTVVQERGFVGVAAPTVREAREALGKIRAQWSLTVQPSERDLERHLREHPSEGEGWEGVVDEESGDSAVRARADVALEATYRTAYIAHVPIETRVALAEWNGDHLTVWTGTQRPFGVPEAVAEAFGIDKKQVRCITPDTGTGFGGKQTAEVSVDAARLARAAKRPVKIAWTREEEFTWGYFRPAAIVDVKSWAARDGTLLSWELRNLNSGTASLFSPYTALHSSVHHQPAESPLPQGPYRSLAAVANTFARECQMDELAAALKLDPVRFRLQNLNDERLRAVLRAAVEHAGYTPSMGVALGFEKGGRVATVAQLRPPLDVVKLTTAYDCGAIVDADAVRNQIEGCAVMGLGGALFEAIHFENGRILNPHLKSYRVPRFSDLPQLEVVLLDQPGQPSAGAGETPIVTIAPAIANAVAAMTGKRLRSLPLAP